VQKRITEALHRYADIDARRIHVEAEGPKVILSGSVRSWIEKDEAQRAAWGAPGVTAVDNRIGVFP
ncbi:MAG: BON domain-containing protein, partial [Vicinamibacterales bacterium]